MNRREHTYTGVNSHLHVLVGLEFADVLLQEEQVQGQVVPLAAGSRHDAHRGQRLVDFQEVGVSLAEEGAEAAVDHHGNQSREDHQVHQTEDGEERQQGRIQSCEGGPGAGPYPEPDAVGGPFDPWTL